VARKFDNKMRHDLLDLPPLPFWGPSSRHFERTPEHGLPGVSLRGGSGRDGHGQDAGGTAGSILRLAAAHAGRGSIGYGSGEFTSPNGGVKPPLHQLAHDPGALSKKGLMMNIFLASSPADCMATSCPHTRQKHEAENFLKTEGQKRAFSKNEAENILKISQLQ